ncbi:MAG TPA: class I tRNA ligase family protein, partial [Candidatus Paceibacterota bacterium]|nr:class I tRNA ligase family protein [Candidatus Paceibacterota bacterium]
MNSKFTKPYNPTENESAIYKLWEQSGHFNPDNLPNVTEGPFTIIMPPPNANGQIHAGHALFLTLEDIMIRYKRMRGFKTLWLPGTDHAGFETQVVYEKKLEKEGRSRFNLSREELYAEIMDFVQANKKATEDGMRQLGASCDWSREKFTLDPDIIQTVYATFKQMFDDGLVYRGKRIVNWCTKHQTSLSDLETLSEARKDKLYYMQYGPLVVATVRPETMFGDVALAVNPDDERYRQYIDQDILVQTPIGELKLKVIADEAVEKDFGTGALKITPAHDANDFEIGLRHNLPSVEVIDHYGKLNEKTGKYAGLKIEEAREAVVRDLTELGLLLKTEDYEHDVSVCYKCGRVIEPRIIPQWF